jgi:uncharacterized membrane protein
MRMRLPTLAATFLLSVLLPFPALAQTPPEKPPAKTPTIPPQETIPSPVSKHYPILIVAHGNDPSWSLRLGMKGPERLDRANYPPIVLEPADVTRDESGSSWTYNSKDAATGAPVAVKLTRAICSESTSDTKYTFQVEVNHAQIGILQGCGVSSPEKFPEFRKKNQLLPDDDASAKDPKDKDKDKDKDKKTVLDPITKFTSPTAIAYIDSAGRVIVAHGEIRKIAATAGTEPALSHDGKRLLYTRSTSKTGPDRSIMHYEVDTGRSREVAGNASRQAFWSPDDSHFAYLKYDGRAWQVWVAPSAAPEQAALLSPQDVNALHGWTGANSVLATDLQNAYWLSADRPPESVTLKEIFGSTFQSMSSDTLRLCPVNPDLLLVSAYYMTTPAGSPADSMNLSSTFFLFELRSKRRAILGPPDAYARDAEWSRDALQIFFTKGVPNKGALVTDRIFWDGTSERRYVAASNLVIGK